MTCILLVRHGQTEWNRIERFRGQVDVPLNDTGHRQAQLIAAALQPYPVRAVYAGPLTRVQETARPIAAAFGLPLQTLPGLLDIHCGDWAGLSVEEVRQRYPELTALWLAHPERFRFPGGESFNDVRDRAVTALHEVIAAHPGETVVLAGHQVTNKLLLGAVLGLDTSSFWHIRQSNACLNIFEYHTPPDREPFFELRADE